MATATENGLDYLLNSFNEVKSTGTGRATRGDGNTLTPEPDMDRILADQARRDAEAASSSSQTTQSEPQQPNTQSIPVVTVGDHGVEEEDEEEEEDGDYVPPTPEQTAAVKRIMKTKKNNSYGRLGVKRGSSGAHVLQGFIKTGKEIHPNYNPEDEAEAAFLRVINAARKLGVSELNISAMKEWNGSHDDDETLRPRVDSAGDTDMDAPTNEPAQPAQPVQAFQAVQAVQPAQPAQPFQAVQAVQLAQPAQPFQAVQAVQPAQPAQPFQAVQPVQAVQPAQPAQPFQAVQAVQPAQPAQPFQAVQAVQPAQPAQPFQAVQAVQPAQPAQPFQAVQPAQPAQPFQAVQPAQPAQPAQPFQTVQAAQPAQPVQPFQTVQAAQPFQAVQAAQPFQAVQAAQPFQAVQAVQPIQPEALPQAVQKVQSETMNLWAKMGWDTYRTSDGDTILSHKALCKEGKDPYAFQFTVMTREKPYFQVKMGSEIGRQEMNNYLAMPKIYKVNTDRGDKSTPVYTYRDKENYAGLLWTATKPRKQTQAGVKPRTGDTQCCVLWKNGSVSEMARAYFKTVTTENEKTAIEKYCKFVGVQFPWEMDPIALTVPTESAVGQQLLQAGRTGATFSLNTAAPKPAAQDAPIQGIVASLQSSMTSLQTNLQAMERNQTMMLEQMNKQQVLQMQMQQQLQLQQQQQMDLSRQLLQMLGQFGTTSSQRSASVSAT